MQEDDCGCPKFGEGTPYKDFWEWLFHHPDKDGKTYMDRINEQVIEEVFMKMFEDAGH